MSIDVSAELDAYDGANFEHAPVISEERTNEKQEWTNAQIKRVVLNIFIGLGIFFTLGLISCAVTYGIVALGALAVLPAALTCGLIYWRCKIMDYDNPQELAKLKEEAPTLNFKQLYQKHGCENLIRHNILPLHELQRKFNLEIQTMNFEEVLNTFDTNELTNHAIISSQHGQFLTDLKSYKNHLLRQYNQEVQTIDARYPRRTERLRRDIQRANNQYNPNNRNMNIPGILLDVAAEFGREQQIAYDRAISELNEWKVQSINNLNDQYSRFKINIDNQ